MFSRLREFFRTMEPDSLTAFAPDDHRTAVAALLVHVMAVDGVVTNEERVKLKALLEKAFGLNEDETEELIAEAERQDRESVDLYNFTSLIKRSLDEAGRFRVIEMLWELTLADGDIEEVEKNVMWRIANLIGVSPRDRVLLRHKVLHNLS